MRSWHAVWCIVAITLPSLAPAQAVRAGVETGVIRGVVYDSLAQHPLAGARVWTAAGTSAMTDSTGRFLLVGVPVQAEPTVVLAEHPVADSVGLSTLVATVQVTARDTSDATIAIPSYATLHAAACAGLEEAGEEDGILFGTIRDAATGAPSANAVAELRWRSFRSRGAKVLPEVTQVGVDATADGSGTYYACGLPASSAVQLRARGGPTDADSAASDEITLTIGPRRILRRDLLVGAGARTMLVASVVDTGGGPLAGARVFVGDGEPVLTASNGRATVRSVATGTRLVGARSIGFRQLETTVDVVPGDTLRLTLRLDRLPPELPTIRVNGLLAEIEARRALGGGYIISGEELAGKPNLNFSVPMEPSIRNESHNGMLDLYVRGRLAGWCRPKVLLNGFRSGMDEISMYRPDELLAIELYVNPNKAPAQFMRPSEYNCGLLLVWTKR
jgi:hypothetical protein